MGLFSTDYSYLGLDFDAQSVKVVELRNENGRPRLVTYGYYDRDIQESRPRDHSAYVQETARIINQVCLQARTTTRKVISALPSYSVFSSILTLPPMPKKELRSAVEWEAKKVIPLPLEEMILDWKLLENGVIAKGAEAPVGGESEVPEAKNGRSFLKIAPEKKVENIKVMLTAAPKDLVKRYIDVCRVANLSLLSLDTESFALIRSLIGSDKSAIMIVDIGAMTTSILIVVDGIPILNRSIDVGGRTITEAIAASLNISLPRAEQFKYDIGMNVNQAGQGGIPKTIEAAVEPIVDEIKYSLNLYRTQGQKQIEKIVLTGGTSLLADLPNYLSSMLQIKVFLGDPWARIIHPVELKPVLDEIGARFSVSVGLAMRDIQ